MDTNNVGGSEGWGATGQAPTDAWQRGEQQWGGQEGTGGSGTWEEGSGEGGLDWVGKGKMGAKGGWNGGWTGT